MGRLPRHTSSGLSQCAAIIHVPLRVCALATSSGEPRSRRSRFRLYGSARKLSYGSAHRLAGVASVHARLMQTC